MKRIPKLGDVIGIIHHYDKDGNCTSSSPMLCGPIEGNPDDVAVDLDAIFTEIKEEMVKNREEAALRSQEACAHEPYDYEDEQFGRIEYVQVQNAELRCRKCKRLFLFSGVLSTAPGSTDPSTPILRHPAKD